MEHCSHQGLLSLGLLHTYFGMESWSEWRFFVNSSELWSFIYLSSFIRICSYTSLLCFNNLCEQWVVDFLGPSMSVTCPATLGSLRLKISFTRSVLATFFFIPLIFLHDNPNCSKTMFLNCSMAALLILNWKFHLVLHVIALLRYAPFSFMTWS